MNVKMVFGTLAALTLSTVANASIILNFTGGTPTTFGTPNYTYTYTAQLSADQKVETSVNPSFVVFFDIGPLVSFSTSLIAPGLTGATVIQENTSPQAFLQAAPDNAGINNIRIVLAGTVTPTGTTSVDLFSLTLVSQLGPTTRNDFQSAQAEKNAPGDPTNGALVGNTTTVEGPAGAIPEPASMGLIGSGLVGLGLLIRRRNA